MLQVEILAINVFQAKFPNPNAVLDTVSEDLFVRHENETFLQVVRLWMCATPEKADTGDASL